MSTLTISNLGKQFCMHHANRMIRSCENISFTLEQGDFIGIVGRSGAGKSTILKCINRTYSFMGQYYLRQHSFWKNQSF